MTTFNDVDDLMESIDGLLYEAESFEGTWDNSDILIKGYKLRDYVFVITLDSEVFMMFDDAHSQLWIGDYYTPGETSMALVSAMINCLIYLHGIAPFKVSRLDLHTEIPKYARS